MSVVSEDSMDPKPKKVTPSETPALVEHKKLGQLKTVSFIQAQIDE